MAHRTEARGELGYHRVELPADPHSTSEARDILRQLLAGTSVDLEAALLVASELVTNAVVHARTPFHLTLTWPPLRIEVTDLMPLSAKVAALIHGPCPLPAATATGGRGFPIARAIATRIGAEDHGEAGKTIWAELEGSASASATTAPLAPEAEEDRATASQARMTELAADIALTEARLAVTKELLAETTADAARLRDEGREARRPSGGRIDEDR
jgi:hypothetical protein